MERNWFFSSEGNIFAAKSWNLNIVDQVANKNPYVVKAHVFKLRLLNNIFPVVLGLCYLH